MERIKYPNPSPEVAGQLDDASETLTKRVTVLNRESRGDKRICLSPPLKQVKCIACA